MENQNQAPQGLIQKYPKSAPFVYGLIGLAAAGYGFFLRGQILEAEVSGGTITLPRIMFPVYDAIGANGIFGIFALIGVYFFYRAALEVKNLSK